MLLQGLVLAAIQSSYHQELLTKTLNLFREEDRRLVVLFYMSASRKASGINSFFQSYSEESLRQQLFSKLL